MTAGVLSPEKWRKDMSKIMELRTKRNTLWEQTKAFLEKHRGENGLVEASAVEQYNKMAEQYPCRLPCGFLTDVGIGEPGKFGCNA